MIDITANTLSELNKTTSQLLHILYSTSEEELNFRPGSKWSIGQIGDHFIEVLCFSGNTPGKYKNHRKAHGPKIRTG